MASIDQNVPAASSPWDVTCISNIPSGPVAFFAGYRQFWHTDQLRSSGCSSLETDLLCLMWLSKGNTINRSTALWWHWRLTGTMVVWCHCLFYTSCILRGTIWSRREEKKINNVCRMYEPRLKVHFKVFFPKLWILEGWNLVRFHGDYFLSFLMPNIFFQREVWAEFQQKCK